MRVGFDDDGRVLGLDVQIWHDNGAYTPYGIIVPIITATQLLGPYKPGAYRVEFWSLYTNTVIVTPYRGAGRPQGVFAMERTMDAIADFLGIDRAVVRERNFIQPEEMPYDHQMTFQDGRPLIYDSGDFPASLALLKKLVGWDDFASFRDCGPRRGTPGGNRVGLLCRGNRRGAVRRWARPRRDRRPGECVHGAHLPGSGPPDGVRADRRRRARRPVRHGVRHDRRHPAVRLFRRHFCLPRRGDERQRRGAGRPQGASQGVGHRGGCPGGRCRGTWKSSTA